ncbi:DUF7507 domain-containing protein [Ornithinibacillus halotolerans]|uniref:VWFA domain-containing protein n=1 Tax=Ornithinibacillus halotolerans TaxID=1274357 RepID=A0A916RZY2_9BACI|nr:Cna B-type domain-containing protein [Ornithinibacillus halotolerans]GGA75853.1 hypothetical protein GCM10008025_19390 [Ornithinibacillus halotolerans]
MNWFKEVVSKRAFKLFSIFLIVFYMFTTSIPTQIVVANEQYDVETGEHGDIRNEKTGREYERAMIDKKVSWGNKPGEYFIDLTIEGKDATQIETTDIVLVYDNSNSMNNNQRVTIAKDATTNFVNGLLHGANNNFQVALVTYGSVVFDGRQRTWSNYPGRTDDYSFKTLTKNPANITSKLPSNVPQDRGGNTNTWHGGTFTQQGLEEAGIILNNSTADKKVIVTITDGVPTFSYNTQRNVVGDGSNYATNNFHNGNNTIREADGLKSRYELYTIAVEISGGNGATQEEAEQLMTSISSSPDHAYFASTVGQLQAHLEEIATKFNKSIVNGSVVDPIGEMFVLQGGENFTRASNNQLTDGSYYLDASNPALLNGVTVTTEGQTIKINGLNLGEDEIVTLRYKVQIDTEEESFETDQFYRTNGETILVPRASHPDERNVFPEPYASTKGISVSGVKLWEDYGLEENRPNNITIKLMRDKQGVPTEVERATVVPDAGGTWEYEFLNQIKFDRYGNLINYYVEEETVEGYEPVVNPDNPLTITNKLIVNPEITLVKEANRDGLVAGEQIEFTFTVTNTGNVPLDNIQLADELEGISEITFETVNGEEIDDPTAIVLKPQDILIAKATYTITQEDVDSGQVINHATVTGTSTTPDQTTVKDEDDVKISQQLVPDILLEKTSDIQVVTEQGQEITYTFTVTNTGNVTLTNVQVNDPMLGGTIELEKNKLAPGESTIGTATYVVTQTDVDRGEIINTATTKGTPPNYDPGNPNGPQIVTDEDDNMVLAEQTADILLEKEANRDHLVTGEEIRYTFTATNSGNVTLSNVTLTDELDGLSEITYLSINGNVVADPTNIILKPGDVLVAEATYTVTQADVDSGEVVNFATVNGTDPNGDVVEDNDSVEIHAVVNSGIELKKSSNVEEVTEAGQQITYTFTVTNTGNVTLTDVQVNDPMINDLGIDISLNKTTLAPNESTTGTAIYTVTEEDMERGKIMNVATATGTPPNPNHPEPEDTDEVEVPVGSIHLEKRSIQEVFTEIGQTVTYKLVITNTGEIRLTNVQLNDPLLGGDIELNDVTLDPGETTEIEVDYVITEQDFEAGEVHNTAEATGETPKGTQVEDQDSDVTLKASILLEKTSDVDLVTQVDQQVTYTFTVTNAGKVTLTDVQVNDPMLGGDITLESTVLEPGESTIGTATYYVTQEDIDRGKILNTATTVGSPPNYNPNDPNRPPKPMDQDDDLVSVEQTPAISLEKETDREGLIAGEQIEYLFTVVNTGNVTLENVVISDILEGISEIEYVSINGQPIITGEAYELWNTYSNLASSEVNTHDSNKLLRDVPYLTLNSTPSITLKPDDMLLAKAIYTITQADVDNGQVANEATVKGTSPTNVEVTDKDDEIVEQERFPAIELEKTSDVEEVTEVGQEITYTFTATNTGNVTLTGVTVNDPMLDVTIELEKTTLAPGESTVGTATYIVTQADIDQGEIINLAVAEGTPPGYDPEDPDNPNHPQKPKDEDENRVAVEQTPAIQLIKSADRDDLVAGEQIGYTFTATNTGNVTLTQITITDRLEGISEITYISINGEEITNPPSITLEPDDVLVAEATYTITQQDVDNGHVTNQATVIGLSPNNEEVTDIADEIVEQEQYPVIELEKTSDVEKVTEVGQEITYTFTATNTGNVTLTDVIVNDPMLDVLIELEKTTLAPGESTVGTATYIVTQADMDNGEIVNIATVEGTPPGYDPEDPDNPNNPEKPRDEAKDEVPVIQNPAINLIKEADRTDLVVNEDIQYRFTVVNVGNVSLTDVRITDLLEGVSEIQYVSINGEVVKDSSTITLKPGDILVAEATYNITQQDVDNGKVINDAIVTGKDLKGEEVTDKDSVLVEGELSPSISLEKTSDMDKATKVGQVVTYTFKVTNTGNVTLKDIVLNDPMLGGTITLGKTTLLPGETIIMTEKYIVTNADLEKQEIENIADVTGHTSNGKSVSDKDSIVIPIEQAIPPTDDKLVQTSNNLFGLTGLGLLLLAAGTTMLGINRRRKTIIND